MAKETHSVKRYDRIRKYLSLIYLYGYFSREDFEKLLPQGKNDYDFCLRIIKDVYPELHEGRFQEKRKLMAVDKRSGPEDEDRIASTYFLSSLSDEELVSVLLLLQGLHRTRKRVGDAALAQYEKSDSTARRRLNELVDFGFLDRDAQKQYSVHPDLFSRFNLTDEELLDLYRFVRFCDNVVSPRVPARFLLRTLERAFLRRGLSIPQQPLFQFLNRPNQNIFDEDMVFALEQGIREYRRAEIEIHSGKQQRSVTLIPVGLRLDQRLGRWYLLSLAQQPTMRRISGIHRVKLGEPVTAEAWETAAALVTGAFADSLFSGHLNEDGQPRTVEAELCFGENIGLQRQFLRETRGGALVQEGDRQLFRQRINDPVELIPLLRSYAPWLRLRDSDSIVSQRIHDDLLRMREQLKQEEAL